jgi:RES domain-containing protein
MLRGEIVDPPGNLVGADFGARAAPERMAELEQVRAEAAAEIAPATTPVTGAVTESVDAAQARSRGLAVPTGVLDLDGNVELRTAGEVLDGARLSVEQANTLSKGFQAAVECMLANPG